MIKIGLRPKAPAKLASQEIKDIKKSIEDKISAGRRVKSKDFENYWNDPDVQGGIKRTLFAFHHGKCCYCERKRELTRESDVEHYRPKAKVHGEPTHKGYWWLAYEWKNYLFACKPCNQSHKQSYFPLLTGGRRAHLPSDALKSEKPALINPLDEDPSKFIGFVWIEIGRKYLVKAVGLDDEGRGTETIRLTGINRATLAEERGEDVISLDALALGIKLALDKGAIEKVEELATDISTVTASDMSFAGFARFFFKQHRLAKYISKK